MTVCPSHGIDVDWETEIPKFVERLVEYAYGAVKGKEKKRGFMNFLLNITPDCDCVPWSDTSIVPDIGILASKDPVAIDAASFDLINREKGREGSFLQENLQEGGDKFRGMRKIPMVTGKYGMERRSGSGLATTNLSSFTDSPENTFF